MKFRISFFILISAYLMVAAGCGKDTSGTVVPAAVSGQVVAPAPYSSDTVPPTVLAFNPPSGTYPTLPSVISVAFSESMLESKATDPTNWTVNCPTGTYNATGVTLSGNMASVSLPDLSSVAAGTNCTITASMALTDLVGNALQGNRTVTYTKQSGGGGSNQDITGPGGNFVTPFPADQLFGWVFVQAQAYDVGENPSGVKKVDFYLNSTNVGTVTSAPYQLWIDTSLYPNGAAALSINVTDKAGNETHFADSMTVFLRNYTYSTTDSVGGNGGSAFGEWAALGYLVKGFNVRTGAKVDNMQPVFKSGFGTPSTYNGSMHGGGGGSAYTDLMCPANYAVSGLWGRNDSGTIVSIGIVCGRLDNPMSKKYLGTHGGTGGNLFEIDCPDNTFAVRFIGRSDNLVRNVELGCQ